MDEIPTNIIDLIISGPPYWTYIDYHRHAEGDTDYLWRIDQSYEEYLNDLQKWHRECYRVLRQGRFCIVNLGTIAKRDKTYAIPFHAVKIIEDIGFSFLYEIVWHKINGGRPRARNFVSYPYPGSFTPNIRTEYLLVFRKGTKRFFTNGERNDQNKKGRVKIDDFFTHEIANNVWHIPWGAESNRPTHPCPFPLEIPLRLITLFSLPGETVLDPFMGIGTTAKAAKLLNRFYIGYEREESYITRSRKYIDSPVKPKGRILCRYEKDWSHLHTETRLKSENF